MGQRMIPYCDLCEGEEEPITYRTLVLDGAKPRGADMCEGCYARMTAGLAVFLAKAHVVRSEVSANVLADVPEVGGRKIAVSGQKHSDVERQAMKLWAREKGVFIGNGQPGVAIWQAFYDDDVSGIPADKMIKNRAVA